MENKTSVFILDDDKIVIDGFNAMFREDSLIHVAGNYSPKIQSFENGLSKVQLVKQLKERIIEKLVGVDILLMDIRFRKFPMTGFDLAIELLDKFPKIKIIVFSSWVRGDYGHIAFNVLKLPGYILKKVTYLKLRRAILDVANGGTHYDQEVLDEIRTGDINPKIDISDRQIQVLQELVDGKTAREIGDALFISSYTVEGHLKQLKFLLGENRNTGLVREAIIRKLVNIEPYQ